MPRPLEPLLVCLCRTRGRNNQSCATQFALLPTVTVRALVTYAPCSAGLRCRARYEAMPPAHIRTHPAAHIHTDPAVRSLGHTEPAERSLGPVKVVVAWA
eukprot:2360765-Prymnesium_polylepis.2